MKTTAGLLAVLMISTSVSALAEKVYRWVDENGQTHFSSLPPEGEGKKAERYNVQVNKPADEVEGYRINVEKPQEASPKAESKAETTPQVSKEEADKACADARNYKMLVTSNYSRRFKQEDGEYRPYTDEQRAAEIKKADDQIALYCNQKSSNKTRH